MSRNCSNEPCSRNGRRGEPSHDIFGKDPPSRSTFRTLLRLQAHPVRRPGRCSAPGPSWGGPSVSRRKCASFALGVLFLLAFAANAFAGDLDGVWKRDDKKL